MFQMMIESIKLDSLTMLLRVQPVAQAQPVSVFETTPQQEVHPEVSGSIAERMAAVLSPQESSGLGVQGSGQMPPAPNPQPRATAQRAGPKVGRNDPCPCGSGKKYKKCHGQ
ncbi:MAG: SEC-C domain-containing protein [Candidatus Omnitrophica bacterium]|nr:SEC-C domain-containing protein [Candidatus Omnitrophota bacterium]